MRAADAIKRIGLAERTGRGIDLIYEGLLRYGRPAPDYRRSTRHDVIVMLPGGAADTVLLRAIVEAERRANGVLPVDSLIALGQLRRQRRVDASALARLIQRDEAAARVVLERLVEAGLAGGGPMNGGPGASARRRPEETRVIPHGGYQAKGGRHGGASGWLGCSARMVGHAGGGVQGAGTIAGVGARNHGRM